MKTFVVTGGAGFIGSHLCEELANLGNKVYSIDDYSAGYKRNLKGLDVIPLEGDVTMEYTKDLIKSLNPDGLFHQAASKKNICLNNPKRDLEVNVVGAFNMASICRDLDIPMVHASTGSVYGEAVRCQDEEHPTNPVSYYGISKLAGEKYSRFIANAKILRYFHVIGDRQESSDDRGGVLAIWMRRLEQGLPIIVYGDGTQERSFTYVKDVVKANILAMEKGDGIYNVASGHLYTLNDMVEGLRKFYPNMQVEYQDWLPGDVKKFDVDNTRICNLGMKNWETLDEILECMM